jgi:hypothetical protein
MNVYQNDNDNPANEHVYRDNDNPAIEHVYMDNSDYPNLEKEVTELNINIDTKPKKKKSQPGKLMGHFINLIDH